MASPTFQNFGNNLVVKKSDYRFNGTFTDQNHLLNLFGDDIRTTHLGTLSLFNQWSLINTPLLSMTELKKNAIYLNGDTGEMTFNVPYKLEGVALKESSAINNPKPGIDSQVFSMILGDGNMFEPTFQVGNIITSDFYNGQALIIKDVSDSPIGEGWEYKVALVDNDKSTWYSAKYLSPGTQYFRLDHHVGEFTEQFAGIQNGMGMLKLKHQIGGRRGVEYTITGNAQRLQLSNNMGIDFERSYGNYLNPKDPNFLLYIGENDGAGNIKKNTGSWITMAEVMIMNELLKMEEMSLMFNPGGIVQGARGKTEIVSQGLYWQMKNGNWIKVPKYTRESIINGFGQAFRNRPDIPDTKRFFKLQGGRGAVNEIQRIFNQELNRTANQLGLVLNAKELGIVTGDAMNLNLKFYIGSVFIQGFGTLMIEHNPAFDAITSRSTDEPYVGGLPKRSYTCCIFDLTEGSSTNAAEVTSNVEFAKGTDTGANVYLVRNQAMPGIKISYLNGRTSAHPVSAGKGSVISSRFDGFTTIMENQSSIFLKDPTKSILFELK